MYKFSYYNFFIPIEERNKYLIYNSLSNSLVEIDYHRGQYISNLNNDEIFFLDESEIKLMTDNRIIVDSSVDEFKILKNKADKTRTKCKSDGIIPLVIVPTSNCNMQCIYCFEGEKKSKIEFSENTISSLYSFIENSIANPIAKKIELISILWFGGEPLLKPELIDKISTWIINITIKHNIKYKFKIITNGTLLNNKNWDILRRNNIFYIQITIDGAKIIHDKKRVLKNGSSYDLILNNLKNIPEAFLIVIRINGDKDIFSTLPDFLKDLEERGIWPQHANQIKLEWALKLYDKLGQNEDVNKYFTSYEFQASKRPFAELRLKHYNDWSQRNNKKTKKLKIAYPSQNDFYCGSVENPYGIVIDEEGSVYKCYTSIGRKKDVVQNLNDFKMDCEKMSSLSAFDRTEIDECKTCKVLPICHETCNYRLVVKSQLMVCSPWKFFLNERMKDYYLSTFVESESEHG